MDAAITLPYWAAGFFTVGFGVLATWCVAELRASRLRREDDIKYRGTAALALAAVVADLKVLKSESLTKDAHDEICEQWQKELRYELSEIRKQIDERHGENRHFLRVFELVLTRIAPDVMLQVSSDLRSPR